MTGVEVHIYPRDTSKGSISHGAVCDRQQRLVIASVLERTWDQFSTLYGRLDFIKRVQNLYQRIRLNRDSTGIHLLAITGRGVARVGAKENPQTTVDQFGDA